MPPIVHNLASFFRSGINMRNYEALSAIANVKTVGSLPGDLLHIAAKSNEGGLSKKIITCLNDSYGEAAKILKGVENAEKQAFRRLPPTEKMHFEISAALSDVSGKSMQEIFKYDDALFKEKETEYLLQAESSLIQRLSQIIPDLKNVILTPLGEGNFKRAYKMEFQFADKGKKVAPQVLGVYRDETFRVCSHNYLLRLLRHLSNKSISKIEGCSVSMAKKERKKQLKELHEQLEYIRSTNYGQYGHGALAEANNTEYIRFMSGHKVNPENGLVLPDFYSLDEKNPFVVSRFVGKGDSAKAPFNFTVLGLEHTDLAINPRNTLNGICTDIGGIEPLNGRGPSAIVGSKLGTKISKHFDRLPKSERAKYLEGLIDNSSKQKNLIERDNTLAAVEEIIETRFSEIY